MREERCGVQVRDEGEEVREEIVNNGRDEGGGVKEKGVRGDG